jgi:endonuclease YncB( thermonuclease family)
VSGSGSGGPYERASSKRLKQLLRDRDVKRDPNKLRSVQREVAHRREQGRMRAAESRG